MSERDTTWNSASRGGRTARRRGKWALRPELMSLEERQLLAQYTVNSLADDGSVGTLRWAVGLANQQTGADSIVFSSLFDTPQTITLTAGPLTITTDAQTTIAGPGANLLTINGAGKSGVFVFDSADVFMTNLTITGGSSTVGGGIRNDGGVLTLSNVAVTGNTATDFGGGIATRFGGSTTFLSGLVSNNTAAKGGAGLYNQAANLALQNVTVTANTASAGPGGGVSTVSGTTSLLNATVTANTATSAGGLSITGGGTTVINTIIAANTGGDTAGTFGGSNNVVGVDPKLSPLGDYGGPTLSMSPLPGSPAIGKGTSTNAPSTDQRGQARLNQIDIGAFEYQNVLTVTNTADGVGSAPGQIMLRQAVNVANVLATGDTILFGSNFLSGPQVITLTNGPLALTDSATTSIAGPGANLLQISGNFNGRVFDISGSATIQDLTIANGRTDNGAGVRNSGTLVMTDAVVTGNTATGSGGGLQNSGTATLNGVSFTKNLGNYGAGISNTGRLTISGSTISANQVGLNGGAVWNSGGSVTVSNSSITGNGGGQVDNGGLGGAFYSLSGTLSISGSTISGNSVTGADARGGAIFIQSVQNSPVNTTTITNSTISGNSASDTAGAIYQDLYATSTLTNVTITGNSAGVAAGGIRVVPGSNMTLTNTIVGGQKANGDIFGNVSGTNNVIGVDPKLSALGDFGGPTLTMVPLPGSPALGAGTSTGAPTTDQRGFARSGQFDIGAFQSQSALVVNTATGGVGSAPGALTLRQAVNLANTLPTADTITFSNLFNSAQTISVASGQLVLTDTATTTISGPGTNLLTINAGGVTRGLAVYGGSASVTGLTITKGLADRGGAVRLQGGSLSLTGVNLTNSSATLYGGGAYNGSGTLSLTNCVISGNLANTAGNANSPSGGGGGVFSSDRTNINGCLILNNVVEPNNVGQAGGGILGFGGTINVVNTTIAGNTGSGVATQAATINLLNCTIAYNTIFGVDGGPDQYVTPTNCLAFGNGQLDFVASAGGPMVGNNNVVGSAFALQGSNNIIGANILVSALGNYGGPTQTYAILPGSPAIGAGQTANAPKVDQRGLPRTGGIDAGAFQSQGFTIATAPGANPQSTAINTAFPNPLTVVVTAKNAVEPVNGGVISYAVTPVGGAAATLSAATATIASGKAAVNATANGTTGTYLVTASAKGATDTAFALINTEAASLTVTTPFDVVNPADGLTSLREAIALANSRPGPDTIVIAPSMIGKKPLVIRLNGSPLVLTDRATTTIQGPGANRLTISGAGKSRVFDVQGGSLALSKLTVANGKADYGAGIRNIGGQVTLTDVVLRDNQATVAGGGFYNEGSATVRRVTVTKNSASLGGGVANLGQLGTRALKLSRNKAQAAGNLFNRGRLFKI